MAFANGVLMRSGASWAWAREDGTVLQGTTKPLLGGRPWVRLPVVRSAASFAEMVLFSLRLHRLNGGRRGARLLACLAVCVLAGLALSAIIHSLAGGLLGGVLLQALSVVIALAALQVGMGTRVWRYHGAEHKAVNAYEAGADLRDVAAVAGHSRIHDRCGTNLLAIIFVLTLACVPLGGGLMAQAASLAAMVVLIALALELFRLVERRPAAPASRAVLLCGRSLQRLLTTREPHADQLELACRALCRVVEAESAAA